MRWIRHPQRQEAAEHYAREFDIHPLTAQLLLNRGVDGLEAMRAFLYPSLDAIHDPFLMKGMDSAVRRIRRALVRKERIHVHGDYDVDGISATSVLLLGLRELGADVHYHITNRNDPSVGLSVLSLERDHLPHAPALLITADCGTTNVEAIERAAECGVDVIVVDHHSPGPRLPKCVAVLNPIQPGCAYPFKTLAAVGVAWTLVYGLDTFLQREETDWPKVRLVDLMDLVALGTVADVVPLVGQNRIFVRTGLPLLRKARRPGICALMRSAGLIDEESTRSDLHDRVNARCIGFRLAPLLNAAGRMGDANKCVELLSTDSFRVADAVSRELEKANLRRQRTEREILQQAVIEATAFIEAGHTIIVLARSDWHPGVLGIVASRLMERFHLPAIVAAIDASGLARGSVRCPEDVDMLAALERCSSLLETFGGHRVAAGVSFREDVLEPLRVGLTNALAEQHPEGRSPVRLVEVDAQIDLDAITGRLLDELEQLAPFGAGNPEPVFETSDLQPISARSVGGDNLRVRLRDGSSVHNAFGFGLGSRARQLRSRVDVLFTPRPFRQGERLEFELILRDIRERDASQEDAAE